MSVKKKPSKRARRRASKKESGRERHRAQAPPSRSHAVSPPVLPEAPVDAGATAGQDRANSSPTPSTGPEVPRADEPAPAKPIDQGSPEPSGPPRPPSEITRPYSIEAVLDSSVALRFSEWCQAQGGVDLGIGAVEAEDGWYVGVADQDVGWHFRPSPDLPGRLTSDALRTLLGGANPPRLIVQDMGQALSLAHLLTLPPRQLLNQVDGDTARLLDLLGRGREEPPYWSSPADAAYDAFVTQRHYAKQAPAFYKAVSVLRGRQKALYEATGGDWEGKQRWTIKFQDLALRVIAHFSQEPMLLRAFEEDQDPLAKTIALLGVETEMQAMALIIWAMVGFDTTAVMEKARDYYPHLPVSQTDSYKALCETKMPVLANSFNHHKEDFERDRSLTTLYGNRVGVNWHVSEAIAERYFRSERELLDVCAAAFWDDGEITIAGIGWGQRTSSVNGWVEGDRAQWHDIISQVGELVDSHLSVKPNSSLFWVD